MRPVATRIVKAASSADPLVLDQIVNYFVMATPLER